MVHSEEDPDCIGPCRPFCRSLYRLLELLWEVLEVHCYSPHHGLALGPADPGPGDTDPVLHAGDGQEGPETVQIAVGGVERGRGRGLGLVEVVGGA